MIRLYTDNSISSARDVALSASQAHYLRNVMRQKSGDEICIFNAQCGEWRAKILELSQKSGKVHTLAQQRLPLSKIIPIQLIYTPLKASAHGILIEKACELGVSHLHPVLTARAIVREINHDKMIARLTEATEQCGRLDLPAYSPLESLEQLLANWPRDKTILVGDERSAKDCTKATESLRAAISADPSIDSFLIGPEGGFSEEEFKFLQKHSFLRMVSFGSNILRAETAGIAAIAFMRMFKDL